MLQKCDSFVEKYNIFVFVKAKLKLTESEINLSENGQKMVSAFLKYLVSDLSGFTLENATSFPLLSIIYFVMVSLGT